MWRETHSSASRDGWWDRILDKIWSIRQRGGGDEGGLLWYIIWWITSTLHCLRLDLKVILVGWSCWLNISIMDDFICRVLFLVVKYAVYSIHIYVEYLLLLPKSLSHWEYESNSSFSMLHQPGVHEWVMKSLWHSICGLFEISLSSSSSSVIFFSFSLNALYEDLAWYFVWKKICRSKYVFQFLKQMFNWNLLSVNERK